MINKVEVPRIKWAKETKKVNRDRKALENWALGKINATQASAIIEKDNECGKLTNMEFIALANFLGYFRSPGYSEDLNFSRSNYYAK